MGFYAFCPIILVLVIMGYSRPSECLLLMFMRLLSHKNESLGTLIHLCMSSWALGNFMGLGFGIVLFVTMQMDKIRDFIH